MSLMDINLILAVGVIVGAIFIAYYAKQNALLTRERDNLLDVLKNLTIEKVALSKTLNILTAEKGELLKEKNESENEVDLLTMDYETLLKTNEDFAKLLNDLIPIAEIITKNTGWTLNRELNKIVAICNQYRNLVIDNKMESDEEQEKN